MKKKRVIIAAIALIAIMGMILAVEAGQTAEADTYVVKKGELLGYLELRGKVDLDKKRKIYSRVEGTVENIYVKAGDLVEEDTGLLRLDTEDLDLNLEKSREAYAAAKAAAEEVRTSIKPEQVAQAGAVLEQAKVALDTARREHESGQEKLDKIRELFRNGAVSQQELKDAELLADASAGTVKDLEQKVKIAQYDFDLLRKGAPQEAVAAAEANARQSGLQVEDAKKGLDRSTVYAGLKGLILSKYVSEGDMLQPGTPVFEVGDGSTAYISVSALSDDAVKIKEGQKAIISGEALKEEKLEGEVDFIAPKAEESISSLGVEQQRVEVRIKFDNSRVKLKPGYGVDVDIITDERKATLYVPYKAVFQVEEKDSVFAVINGRLVLKTIRKGIENNDYIEIAEGLSEGERVVVDPDSSLKQGTRVKGKTGQN